MKTELKVNLTEHRQLMRRAASTARERILFSLNQHGFEVVRQARAYSGGTQPPLEVGGTVRPAHAGGWADITGDLARSMDYEILEKRGSAEFKLRIGVINAEGVQVNRDIETVREYARYLDNMQGYSVWAGLIQQAFKNIENQLEFIMERDIQKMKGLDPRRHGEFQFNIQWADLLLS